MTELDTLFERLATSRFRSGIALGRREADYLDARDTATIRAHAERFVAERLAPANPRNDGRQTPWRNHPVFVAQHATGTCCRSCLFQWHGIPEGQALAASRQAYVVDVIMAWLECPPRRGAAKSAPKG